MKRKRRETVDTIEKLAALMAEGFSDVDARFDSLENRMGKVETELREIRRTLDRMDTRIAALELAVFGASGARGRVADSSLLERISRLEKAVFKK